MTSKLKSLEELKFETIGDEFIYLYEKLSENNSVGDTKNSEDEDKKSSGKPPTIEELREQYSRLLNEKDIREKYEKKSIYWSETQEKAISDYVREKDSEKRSLIFSKDLYQPFKKLIENIIFTYKLFRNDIEVNELQVDCMSFLITKIDKFNTKSGTKAFAYFGTIAKHYLMGEKKTVYKNQKSNIDIDSSSDEVNSKNFYTIDEAKENLEENNSQTSRIFYEIIIKLEEEIDRPKMLPNDRKVGEAIIYIFKNHELLDIYNKNVVYHLLKERTGLQTKEITYSLSRFKSLYRVFKEDFLKSDM